MQLNGRPKRQHTLEVCYSPALLSAYGTEGKSVIVIDVLRASSAICTAIGHGVKEIIPVLELEEAWEYKRQGYKVAAERKGEVVGGFDFGNSPYSFMSEDLAGATVVLTTSNCTRAILQASDAKEVLMGSFGNISALCEHLAQTDADVLLLCSGWKDRFNLEDTLFAGAVVQRLQDYFLIECDAALAAMDLYEIARLDLRSYLRKSSHNNRLNHLHIEEDILYCLQEDKVDVVPVFKEGRIISLYPVLV